MSRWLIVAGLVLVVIGLILHFAPGLLGWFGKLPGDVNLRGERGRLFMPITSMIILSLVLTVLINLFGRH